MNNDSAKRSRRIRRQKTVRFFINLFAWVAVAMLYYIGFSILFDTPAEHRMRHSADKLRQEYELLSERYDSLEMVLDNITERDRSVFRVLFEADPYDFDTEENEARLALHEKTVSKSRHELKADLAAGIERLNERAAQLEASYQTIKLLGDSLGEKSDRIPSIQPADCRIWYYP